MLPACNRWAPGSEPRAAPNPSLRRRRPRQTPAPGGCHAIPENHDSTLSRIPLRKRTRFREEALAYSKNENSSPALSGARRCLLRLPRNRGIRQPAAVGRCVWLDCDAGARQTAYAGGQGCGESATAFRGLSKHRSVLRPSGSSCPCKCSLRANLSHATSCRGADGSKLRRRFHSCYLGLWQQLPSERDHRCQNRGTVAAAATDHKWSRISS